MVAMGVAVIRHVVLFGVLVALAAACKSPKTEVGGIRLGMTKDQLVTVVGQPDAVRDPTPNERGEMEDIWEFALPSEVTTGRDVAAEVLTRGFGSFKDPTAGTRHVFHFINDRLVSWGLETTKDQLE